ncbi:MAG: FkbM family methyltransferase [Verrucomicrobia bacterium]|nr:FkbM family methyltransferase [Verrucomicrobiota bacterium]
MVAYGSDGGAWQTVLDQLNAESVVYSFGIGREFSFDMDVIQRHGAVVHAFDPTPDCVEWVRNQTLPEQFVFHEVGLAAEDGTLEFFPPRKAGSAHWTPLKRYRNETREPIQAGVKTLRTLMKELGHTRIDLLKIDIEGGEYAVIDQLIDEKIPVKQILVEFHHAYDTIPLSKTVDAVNKLRGAGYRICAISPRGYEFSFWGGE